MKALQTSSLRYSLLTAGTLFASLWLSGCGSGQAAPEAAAEHPVVPVAKVERADLSRDVNIAAEFKPYQEVELHAKIAGYLRRISVDVGDRVRAGQVIGVLEVPEMAEDQAQAAAAERRTHLEVDKAQSEVQRADSLLKMREVLYNRLVAVSKARPNMIAQQELDDAAAKYQEAKAQVAVAKASLAANAEQVQVSNASRKRVDTMMRYLEITAPFSGMVTKRYADPGAMIQAGTASQSQAMPVIRLSEIDRLRLTLPVPESAVARVRLGAPVEVRVDSLGRVFEGKVARFTGELNSATRTMDTQVDVMNPGGVLKPGMFATATLGLEGRMNVLTVPVQALPSGDHGKQVKVWVVDDQQRLQQRAVQIGLETPDRVEVVSGLNEKDKVVVGQRGSLKAGMRVEPTLLAQAEHGR